MRSVTHKRASDTFVGTGHTTPAGEQGRTEQRSCRRYKINPISLSIYLHDQLLSGCWLPSQLSRTGARASTRDEAGCNKCSSTCQSPCTPCTAVLNSIRRGRPCLHLESETSSANVDDAEADGGAAAVRSVAIVCTGGSHPSAPPAPTLPDEPQSITPASAPS